MDWGETDKGQEFSCAECWAKLLNFVYLPSRERGAEQQASFRVRGWGQNEVKMMDTILSSLPSSWVSFWTGGCHLLLPLCTFWWTIFPTWPQPCQLSHSLSGFALIFLIQTLPHQQKRTSPQKLHICSMTFPGLSSAAASREGLQSQAPGPDAWTGPGLDPGCGPRKTLPSKFKIPSCRSAFLQDPGFSSCPSLFQKMTAGTTRWRCPHKLPSNPVTCNWNTFPAFGKSFPLAQLLHFFLGL